MNSRKAHVGSLEQDAKRISVVTLGCKVNTYESELITEKLEAGNFRRAEGGEPVDLYIFNTCTVTAEAGRQTRQMIRRAIRTNPHARVVVTGCHVETDAKACADIPGVDLVVGNSQKLRIPEMLDAWPDPGRVRIVNPDIRHNIDMPQDVLQGYDGQTRAYVQVQQGCDQGCTFCIIHKARGPNRSFSAPMIIRQCQQLVDNGYGEIVLCGVDIGSYGEDRDDECDLADLIEQVLQVDGDFRIRLSSIDPAHLSDRLIDLVANSGQVCPHLHLSMQSGNTLILKRMKRRATREVLYDRVLALRSRMPELVLGADILVGFPTESPDHFNQTLEAMESLEIAYPHVFAYSPREGTPAARIPSQIDKSTRKERAALARDTGSAIWSRVASRQKGARGRVLVETVLQTRKEGAHRLRGRLPNYFPVVFEGDPGVGAWEHVEITGTEGTHLTARACTIGGVGHESRAV